MQYFWLNKKDNKKLVLIFNGWGMNETPFKHLNCNDYDVLIVFDYRNIDFDFSIFNFEKYKEKYLICWSMGVYISGLFKNILNKFNKKTAINGTTSIVSNDFGIPEKIYNATIKFLNEDTKDKFIKNMFNGGKLNPKITITRNLDELKDELIKIKELKIADSVCFDRVIISDNDKIIPSKNQINFWNKKAPYEIISSTHCPFDLYKNIEELL